MPERTDADWQALADRIAQEVMGWIIKYYGIPSKRRPVYCESWLAHRSLMYVNHWQPHLKIVQALMVADKICDQGWDRELTRLGVAQKRYASFWKYRPIGRDIFDGCAKTDAKAICIAIEKFMEANC